MIPLKQFLVEEAERRGITLASCYVRWNRGRYKHLKTFRKNKRVIFVQP